MQIEEISQTCFSFYFHIHKHEHIHNKHGYKFFTQKRDPVFSEDVMIDIFKENFFYNTDLTTDQVVNNYNTTKSRYGH